MTSRCRWTTLSHCTPGTEDIMWRISRRCANAKDGGRAAENTKAKTENRKRSGSERPSGGDFSRSGSTIFKLAGPHMEDTNHRPTWKTLLAFAIIYFVWGSTFLAIRTGVREVPPLVLAAMRFSVAGLVLFSWVLARGERAPTIREWRSASLLGLVIFVFDYGLLFWAEQRVPSGIAAVMLAMIPVFMALSEIIFLRTQRLTVRLALALLVGIGGVGVLMSHTLNLGSAPIDKLGATALIFASISWSIASVLARKLPLPDSKVMSSGAQMLSGGILLAIAAGAVGGFRNFHPWAGFRGAGVGGASLFFAGGT